MKRITEETITPFQCPHAPPRLAIGVRPPPAAPPPGVRPPGKGVRPPAFRYGVRPPVGEDKGISMLSERKEQIDASKAYQLASVPDSKKTWRYSSV